MVTFTHSQVVSGMRKALQKLTLEQVADGFVAGVGGSAPRGRQTLISYAKALHWPTHQYRESIDVGACADCGMQKRDSVDVKDAMESFESGQLERARCELAGRPERRGEATCHRLDEG